MATTVLGAFNEFMRDIVNLDPSVTNDGRSSRDWLVDDQILKFPNNDYQFPLIHSDRKIFFGSFSRRTKIRELDDIDIMILLHAEKSTYNEIGDTVYLNVASDAQRLKYYTHDYSTNLNSRKIINKFVSSLSSVYQYRYADSNRRGEAATLKLTTKPWNFDIIPAFITQNNEQEKSYFLIPDGSGNWKKTDPRIDKSRTTEINKKHDGKVLNIIRAIKYWQRKRGVPAVSSYLLETMLLNYYENSIFVSQYIEYEIPSVLDHLANAILGSISDHKGIQGDINYLNLESRWEFYTAAKRDYEIATIAKAYDAVNPEYAINKWREVFGINFPKHG